MPALANPRWERFALALFAGLDGKTRIERAQSTAYLAAYPNCKPGNSAESAASQLLRRIKPITERVRELQEEQSRKIQKKIDLSKERIGRRLDLASQMAERQQTPQPSSLQNSASLRSSIKSTLQIQTKSTSNLHNPCTTLARGCCSRLAFASQTAG